MRIEVIISLRATYLDLLRSFLDNRLELTLSGVKQIIGQCRATSKVNQGPKQSRPTYLLMCRTIMPILTSSNLSQPFTILMNSVVGQEISSFRGPVEPALFNEKWNHEQQVWS